MKQKNVILSLLRHGIENECSSDYSYYQNIDWSSFEAFSNEQGLSGVILDCIDRIPYISASFPTVKKLEWIGNVLKNYEGRYAQYEQAIAELAGWYNAHGFKMMVLKGYACSIEWPKPEHRPCGDIDIWLFGKQKEADALLSKEMGIKIDTSHHHHTVFDWHGFTVENHYDFVNVYAERSSFMIEKVFKELGTDDSFCIAVDGEKVYLPSPNLHALFLIRHMVSHFASTEITLRMVLDWAFFVEKHTREVDWEWLDEMLVKFHMNEFVNCINAICVEDLGFPIDIFPEVRFVPELKERVLGDILDPEYTAAEPQRFLSRVIYKYKRWRGNAWKQELCYSESRWSAFWSGIWGHLLKPKSI